MDGTKVAGDRVECKADGDEVSREERDAQRENASSATPQTANMQAEDDKEESADADPTLEYRVLILAPTGFDAALSQEVLARAELHAESVTTFADLLAKLEESAGALVLTEEALLLQDTQKLIDALHAQPNWSDLPVLLLTKSGSDSMLALRALELLGNVILLERPVRMNTLISTLKMALRARARQYQVRGQVAELERANARLYYDAFHDSLTGLPNRLLLHERLERVLKRQVRHQEHTAALLYMDFDRFKVVNDSLGHALGDAMLRAIAERLKSCVRPSDSVARLGGDEFVVLLETVAKASEVIRVAKRIQDAFLSPLMVEGHELHTSASIGIVTSTTPYAHAEEVVRDADIAMYRAKAQGRGGYKVFSSAMHAHAVAALQLEREFRAALYDDELRVAYHPILAVSGELLGFEALVRWQHPERGLLEPSHFLGLAEEAGLIRELDFWVWRSACAQVKRWQEETARPLTLSLNLSHQQFLHADLAEDLGNLLQETGFDPAHLILEITEGVLIDSSDFVKTTVADLKALGVKLYLDDFGTGYSSLAYLQRFPVDALKIDRSFVENMMQNASSAELVRTIISMAQNLGLQVVAEGVETEGQLTALRELGCPQAQGFLFAKPLLKPQAERFLGAL